MGRRAKPTSSSRAASRSPSYADAPSLRASPAGSTPSTEGGARLRLARRRGAAAAVRLPPFLGRELLGCRRGTTAGGQLPSVFLRGAFGFPPPFPGPPAPSRRAIVFSFFSL